MKKIALLLIIFLIIPIYVSAARLKVHLRELNPNKKRELVMGRESDGDLVYIDPYDGEAYLLDEDLFENCEKIVVRIL